MSSTTAKILYRPVGLVSGALGGIIAGAIFKQVWKRVAHEDDPPGALQREYGWQEVVIAAALHGAIFAVVKAVIDRAGARGFQRISGEWPGD
jgi:Protein of unknown function (DUF4235)